MNHTADNTKRLNASLHHNMVRQQILDLLRPGDSVTAQYMRSVLNLAPDDHTDIGYVMRLMVQDGLLCREAKWETSQSGKRRVHTYVYHLNPHPNLKQDEIFLMPYRRGKRQCNKSDINWKQVAKQVADETMRVAKKPPEEAKFPVPNDDAVVQTATTPGYDALEEIKRVRDKYAPLPKSGPVVPGIKRVVELEMTICGVVISGTEEEFRTAYEQLKAYFG